MPSPFAEEKPPQPWIAGKTALVAAAVVFQFMLLVGMVVVDAAPLVLGQTVRLKVQPVDPRDLFRGDYVILGYDFTRTPPGAIEGLSSADPSGYGEAGREVYVSLKPAAEGEYHVVDHVGLTPSADGLYLQGKLTGYGQIHCGIEAYYVQEGEGRAIEDAIRQRQDVFADIALYRGAARLKGVVIDP